MAKLEFVINGFRKPLVIGWLRWPWPIVRLVGHGDLWEIEDKKQVSVISLDDISFDDLWHTRI